MFKPDAFGDSAHSLHRKVRLQCVVSTATHSRRELLAAPPQIEIMQNWGVKWPPAMTCSFDSGDADEDGAAPAAGATPSAPARSGSSESAGIAASPGDDGSHHTGAYERKMQELQRDERRALERQRMQARFLEEGAVPTIEEIKVMRPEDLRIVWRNFLKLASKELIAYRKEEEAKQEAGAAGNGGSAAAVAAERGARSGGGQRQRVVGSGGAAQRAASGGEEPGDGGGLPSLASTRGLPPGTPPDSALARLYELVDRYMGCVVLMMLGD